MTRFIANETFFSDITNSEYVEGFSYSIQNEKLEKLVNEWIAEGKVKIVPDVDATLSGRD